MGPGGVYLAGCSFGLSGEANSSTRKGLITGQVAQLLGAIPDREVPAEPSGGERRSGYLTRGITCLLTVPLPGPSTPGVTVCPLGYACPGTPQKPQLLRKLSRAFQQQEPLKGICSGKNKAPTSKHIQFPRELLHSTA